MSNETEPRHPLANGELSERHEVAASTFNFDPSVYLAEMGEFDMTDAQQIELLQTIWSIMRSFVELGFDVNICEQLFADSDEFPADSPVHVSWPSETNMEMPADGRKD